MITTAVPGTWRDLEAQVGQILSECGFATEVEKVVTTARGAVEIDVFAQETVHGRAYTIISECKHWRSAVPQGVIHGFRTVAADIGAHKGYIISMSGFQLGSFSAAELTNIELVTWQQFQEAFEGLG
jgi:restriction system protein